MVAYGQLTDYFRDCRLYYIMSLNITRKESGAAIWSRRLAAFCFQLLILTVGLHYLGIINTKAGINLFSIAMIGGCAAIILAILGFYKVWVYGVKGLGAALTGVIIASLMFAVPGYFLQKLVALPAIHDITTDLQTPPEFRRLKELRPSDANYTSYPGTTTAVEQAEAYPDIVPLTLERSKENVFDLVQNTIEKKLGWKIVSLRPPSRRRREGIIEAVDKTMIMGFSDDVIIRITGNSGKSRIDIRSASRYGQHDLGANARRIRTFMESIKQNLADVEARKATRVANRKINKRRQTKRRKTRRRKVRRARPAKRRRSSGSSRRRKIKNEARSRKKRRRKRQRKKPKKNQSIFPFF